MPTTTGQSSKRGRERDAHSNPTPVPRRHALLICNGRFKFLELNVPGVAKDAKNLSSILGDVNRCGFEVTCLLDQGLWTVRKAIASACQTSGPNDTLLIYYTGPSYCYHPEELLMPVADTDSDWPGATSIEPDFVLSQMRRSRCGRFVLILDGCHSGAFFKNNRGIPDGMVALTSCSADELSADTAEGGAFTQSFIRALTSPEADIGHDGAVTVDDAYEFIRKDRILVKDSRMHPQKWVWNLPESVVLLRTTMSVFFSYSRADKDMADSVTRALERQGLSVWRDISGIPGGTEWRDSLLAAFGKSQALVLLMTEKAMQAKWVRRELEFADGKSLPIVPLCPKEITPPDWFQLQFGGLQRVPVDVVSIDTSAAALAATLRALAVAKTPSIAAR